jgi:hypothetical protein
MNACIRQRAGPTGNRLAESADNRRVQKTFPHGGINANLIRIRHNADANMGTGTA